MIIRAATASDSSALARIYGHHVLHGFGTFEETPPTPGEMELRRAAVAARGLPYLVAENPSQIIGFAYASPFRARAAYRYTVEDSVYVAPGAVGQGVGKALLSRVISACEALGLRQMIAVIGDSENTASVGVHKALGFTHQGVGKALGYKAGRWVDVVWMQRPLNGGEEGLPQGPGLEL